MAGFPKKCVRPRLTAISGEALPVAGAVLNAERAGPRVLYMVVAGREERGSKHCRFSGTLTSTEARLTGRLVCKTIQNIKPHLMKITLFKNDWFFRAGVGAMCPCSSARVRAGAAVVLLGAAPG